MKKLWISICLLILLMSINMISVHGEETDKGIDGTFSYYNEWICKEKNLEYTYHYEDQWFLEPADEYNHELAKMSLRGALASWQAAGDDGAENIKTLMTGLGYVYDDDSVVYREPTTRSIGYAIGHKSISDDVTVLMVAIRSGRYDQEWAGNMKVGASGDHQGFREASARVRTGISNYVQTHKNQFGSDLKVWIFGYSRGAIVANLTAASLIDENMSGIDGDNVYAYCLGCPQGTVSSEYNSGKYKNIFNIINANDLVTKVPMTSWGFHRYGNNFYLPYGDGNIADYEYLKNNMQLEYTSFLRYNGYEDKEMCLKKVQSLTGEKSGQPETVQAVFDSLGSAIGSREAYVEEEQDKIMMLISLAFSNSTEGVEGSILPMILEILQETGTFAEDPELEIKVNELLDSEPDSGEAVSYALQAHYPELYMAWLDSFEGNEEFFESRGLAETCLEGSDMAIENPFTDILESAYYYDSVLWALGENITTGISDTMFSPEGVCTRAQIVTFLWRAAGRPEVSLGEDYIDTEEGVDEDALITDETIRPQIFTDITTDAYYYDAVMWALEQGITTGTAVTEFSPDAECTREQIVTFLWRAMGRPDPESAANPFVDVDVEDYYGKAVLWAVENEVTTGTSAVSFSPKESCTRGQAVTFLYRTYNLK